MVDKVVKITNLECDRLGILGVRDDIGWLERVLVRNVRQSQIYVKNSFIAFNHFINYWSCY